MVETSPEAGQQYQVQDSQPQEGKSIKTIYRTIKELSKNAKEEVVKLTKYLRGYFWEGPENLYINHKGEIVPVPEFDGITDENLSKFYQRLKQQGVVDPEKVFDALRNAYSKREDSIKKMYGVLGGAAEVTAKEMDPEKIMYAALSEYSQYN